MQGCYVTGILKAFLFWVTVHFEMKIWNTFLNKKIYGYGNLLFSTHSSAVVKQKYQFQFGLKLLFWNDAYIL